MPTQQVIAEHLDLSQQDVSNWMERLRIDWRVTSLDDIRIAYIRSLRETAAGRASNGEIGLATERARLAREQADRIAMQNAITRRELAPVHLIEQVLTRAGVQVATILDGIPGAIKRRVASLSAQEVTYIEREIAQARNVAAAISLADLEGVEKDVDDEMVDPAGAPEAETAG
jgi:phage terminase Nu1 subunit (DNA packaging protein)